MNLFARFLLAMLVCWPAVSAATPAADLRQLFADERAAYYRDEPLAATSEGLHDYDDRLPSVTPESQARRLNADRLLLKRLEAVDHYCAVTAMPVELRQRVRAHLCAEFPTRKLFDERQLLAMLPHQLRRDLHIVRARGRLMSSFSSLSSLSSFVRKKRGAPTVGC